MSDRDGGGAKSEQSGGGNTPSSILQKIHHPYLTKMIRLGMLLLLSTVAIAEPIDPSDIRVIDGAIPPLNSQAISMSYPVKPIAKHNHNGDSRCSQD